MRPTKSILDPTFKYTSSVNTDLEKVFARIRSERKSASDLARQETEANQASVQSIFDARRRGIKV